MSVSPLVARLYLVWLALALVLVPGVAHAQARPPSHGDAPAKSEAAKLKSAADVLMDQDRYADALGLYERAYELSNDPALLYNQGRAHEALGDYPKALERLERFDQEASVAVRARVPGLHELMIDLRGRIATLVIRTNASAARLLVRQKDEGSLSGERTLATRAGPASIEVTAEGYEPFQRDVDLAAGATLTVDAQLVLKKRGPLVVVRTTPNATVVLDGASLGRSPLEVRSTPGSHDLVVRADGYEEEHIAMKLALGDRRDIDLELHKTPGIASRWWFWTGIGAVVLGGVATAIVLTTERPHSGGTFNPGSVSAP